jgi:hypothetical protein
LLKFKAIEPRWQPCPGGSQINALQLTSFTLLGILPRTGSLVMTAEDTLAALGMFLPPPAAPVANYLPFVVSRSLLAVSGQLAFGPNGKRGRKAASMRSAPMSSASCPIGGASKESFRCRIFSLALVAAHRSSSRSKVVTTATCALPTGEWLPWPPMRGQRHPAFRG